MIGLDDTSEIAEGILRAVDLAEPEGLTAVVVPDSLLETVTSALDPASFEAKDVEVPKVYTARSCKGLEFNTTIVVEPAEIVAQSPRGLSDLYVALTRATQRLLVVHAEELPESLSDMPAVAG